MSSPDQLSNSSPTITNQLQDDIRTDNGTVDTHNGEDIPVDSDQYEERFRVDRRKLEQMLHGECYCYFTFTVQAWLGL